MYSLPLPRRHPTCWDPPSYRETPGEHPFHEVSVYDQPLPPDPTSCWNQPYTVHDTVAPSHTFHRGFSARQPAPRQPHLATTAGNLIDSKFDWLLKAYDKMESRIDAIDLRIDNLLPPKLPELVPPYGSQVFGSRDLVQHHPRVYPNDSSAPPHQPSTTTSFELPPYAATGAFQPLQSLPVTAPLLASNRLSQAAIPPPPPQQSSICWSPTSHCRSACPHQLRRATPTSMERRANC